MINGDEVVREEIRRVSAVVSMYRREVVRILIIGLGVGLLSAIAYIALRQFVFTPVLCRESVNVTCAQAPSYSLLVTAVVASIAGLIALVQNRIYRPLLIVLATVISLWGVNTLAYDYAWYWHWLISVVIYGVAYLLFAWLARIRSFVLAIIVTAVVVVIARYILSI